VTRAALAAALLAAVPAERAHTPEIDYALHCQGCHLADGRATPGSVPALAGTVARLARTPGGREYMGRVPGVAQAPLADAELALLLTWVVKRFGGPDDFAPYTPDEVGRLRAQPLVDVAAARRALLENDVR